MPHVRTWYAAQRADLVALLQGALANLQCLQWCQMCAHANKIILPPIGDQLDAVGDLAACTQGGLRPHNALPVGVRHTSAAARCRLLCYACARPACLHLAVLCTCSAAAALECNDAAIWCWADGVLLTSSPAGVCGHYDQSSGAGWTSGSARSDASCNPRATARSAHRTVIKTRTCTISDFVLFDAVT
jgi:hypothetical protein